MLSRSLVSDSATPWTAAHQAVCPWNSAGKNIGVGCHSLLQGILPTQGSNLGLLHYRLPPGKPCRRYLTYFDVQYPRDSSLYVRPNTSGLGRYPGKGNGYLFKSSCLENSLERGGWRDHKESDTTEQLTHSSIFCCLKSEEINSDLFPLFSFMIFFFQIIICFCMHPAFFYSLEGIFAVVYLESTI